MTYPDRNSDTMEKNLGTKGLITDYGGYYDQQMLREISNDDLTPKKSDKITENEIYSEETTENESSEPKPLYEF